MAIHTEIFIIVQYKIFEGCKFCGFHNSFKICKNLFHNNKFKIMADDKFAKLKSLK